MAICINTLTFDTFKYILLMKFANLNTFSMQDFTVLLRLLRKESEREFFHCWYYQSTCVNSKVIVRDVLNATMQTDPIR